MSTPVPEGKDKVRPFRRAEEVQEFVSDDDKQTHAHFEDGSTFL